MILCNLISVTVPYSLLTIAKEGQRIVGKDGTVYEVVVDPLTGKKFKK